MQGDAPDEEYVDEHGECRAEIERLREINAQLVAALKDWRAEATGDFKAKSCGHDFICICVARDICAALIKAESGK